jgi:CBS domain-containing protein
MIVRDVMTRDVITIGVEDSVQRAAQLLTEHGISALPVVDAAGLLVGIVSEGDLIRRIELGTERRRSWWLEVLTPTETRTAEFIKARAVKVGDIMTRNVVTAVETTPLAEVATLMEKNGVKRLPIVRDRKVVGIVSRANLVRALAARPAEPAVASSDENIRERIVAEIRELPGGMPWLLTVTVRDGTVDLWGPVASDDLRKAIRIAAEAAPGVKRVNTNLYKLPAAVE